MEELRLQVTLTPAEGKRLIGKAIANMKIVQKALKNGTILISRSSTCAYVLDELIDEKVDIGRYVCGFVHHRGTCLTDRSKRLPKMAIVNGKVKRLGNPTAEALKKFVSTMDENDVFIKGANLVDPTWKAGIFAGALEGGYYGAVQKELITNKVNLLIPVGLEKFIPTPIETAIEAAGILKVDCSTGMPVDVMSLHGTVITEVQAIKILFNAEAIPIGAGGVSGAEGSVTMVIKGEKQQTEKIKESIMKVKGEERVIVSPMNCSECYTRKPLSQQRKTALTKQAIFPRPCPGFWGKS